MFEDQNCKYLAVERARKLIRLKCSLRNFSPKIRAVSLRIQSEWGKIRTRITSNTDKFYTVLVLTKYWQCCYLLYKMGSHDVKIGRRSELQRSPYTKIITLNKIAFTKMDYDRDKS